MSRPHWDFLKVPEHLWQKSAKRIKWICILNVPSNSLSLHIIFNTYWPVRPEWKHSCAHRRESLKLIGDLPFRKMGQEAIWWEHLQQVTELHHMQTFTSHGFHFSPSDVSLICCFAYLWLLTLSFTVTLGEEYRSSSTILHVRGWRHPRSKGYYRQASQHVPKVMLTVAKRSLAKLWKEIM